ADARCEVFVHARRMWESGLVVASSGNVSTRIDHELIAITPARVSYDAMTEDDIVVVEIESGRAIESRRAPSYELPMHLSIFRSRADAGRLVHTPAPFIPPLSVLR